MKEEIWEITLTGHMDSTMTLVRTPVFTTDGNGRILNLNPFFKEYSGYAHDIAKNTTISALLKIAPSDSFFEILRSASHIGKEVSGDFHIQKADGSLHSVEIRLLASENDDNETIITGVIGLPQKLEFPQSSDTLAKPVLQTKEVYRTIYNHTFEIIFIHDKGIIIDINPAFERRTGYTRKEVIGKNAIETFITPKYKNVVINAMQHEITTPYEAVVQIKDGALMNVEIESRQIIVEGREVRITGIRDISLQKKTELALKESEERYRRLSDIAQDAIFIHKQGIIIDANQSLANMLGYSLEEIISQNIIQLAVLPEYTQRVIDALKNEETSPYEIQVRRKNGTSLFVEIEARMVDYHGEWLRVTIARDISLRKETEKKLEENEQELDSFFSQSQDGFFIMRMDEVMNWKAYPDKDILMEKIGNTLKLVKINQAMKTQLGLETANLAGKALKDIFPWNQFIKTLMTTLFDAGSVTFETSEFRHGKTTIWIEGNYLALLDANGFIRGCCGVRRDITERKMAEQAIQIHNEELKKTNQELDNFVYRVSHDLKAPISSAKGLVNIARLETKPENVSECLSLIEKSMNKLDSFIMDILDYSRNTRMALEPELIVFDELIDEVAGNTKYIQEARKVSINKSILSEFDFYSDKRRLVFILNNIISNAIRFSDNLKPDSYLKINIQTNASMATIAFEDNGIGIHPEHLSRIFEMFYRASESRAGSGLGLYIVKEAVEKLSGTVTVQSQPGKGTTFKITIPNLYDLHQY